MHEKSRRTGRGKRRRDLLAHVPALTDAGDDHASLHGYEACHCGSEWGSQRPALQLFAELREAGILEL